MARAERKRRAPERARRGEAEGFWDRPALMHLLSDVLIVFALVILTWGAMNGIKRMPYFPLRELVVVSEIHHVSRAQIEQTARAALAGNLLAVNLEEARRSFEKLPWVRRAALRRHWPDTLELTVEEHVAVARWAHSDGEPRLVNTRGEVFVAAGMDDLPLFSGPEGSSATMLERYQEFESRLAHIDRRPVALTLSSRAAWQVRLDDGVVLDLGRDQPKLPLAERLDRFTVHYAAAREQAHAPVAAVDMRYPNGFVLRLGQPDRKSAS